MFLLVCQKNQVPSSQINTEFIHTLTAPSFAIFLVCPLSTLTGNTWGSLGFVKVRNHSKEAQRTNHSVLEERVLLYRYKLWDINISTCHKKQRMRLAPLVSLVYTLPKGQHPSSLPDWI